MKLIDGGGLFDTISLELWEMVMAEGPDEAPSRLKRLLNTNALIAVLLGFILLTWSYLGLVAYPILQAASHEIGFALLVAVTIWGAFELFEQAKTDDEWNARIEKIARNVFFGVFKRNFPEEFIKEANILVLDHTFIRSGLNVTYTMSDSTYVDRIGQQQPFVTLHAIARHKVKNVGNTKAKLPVAIGLPNPLIDEMKSACKVLGITIKSPGAKDRKPELAGAEKTFREDMADDQKYTARFALDPLELEPSAEVEIIFDYVMAKEDEDTEIFQTLYPADSVIITVMDKGPTARIVRARSIHVSPLENDTSAESTGTYNFKLGKYLLPHQGFVIWWKKIPPSPAPLLRPVTAAAAAAAAAVTIDPGGNPIEP